MKIRTLAAMAVLALGCSVAQAQVQKLKFASFEAPQAIASQIFTKWIAGVNKDGAGVVEIEYFAGGALGRDPRAQLELLENGVADIAWMFPFFAPGRFADSVISNMPLTVHNVREGSYAVWALHQRGLLRGFENLVPMGIMTGPSMVLFSTKPIQNLDSLAGRKSAASSPLQQKILGKLGAAPVSGFNFSTSAEALQRGSLDVDLTNFSASKSFKQFDVAKHVMILPIGPSMVSVVMSKASYDKLSPAAKAVIDKHRGEPLVKIWSDMISAREEEVRAEWRADATRTYTELSAADRAKAESLLNPVSEEWSKGHPNGELLLRTLREEVAKVRGR